MWVFPYLLPQRKCEYKRDSVGKGIRRNNHAVLNRTAPLQQHGQNHHQNVIKKLPASSHRIRQNGEHVPPSWRQYRYGSLWLCLNLGLIPPKNNLIYVYGDWWFHINYFDSEKSFFVYQMATQCYVSDVPRALQPFTTGCVKLHLPSLRRDASRHNTMYDGRALMGNPDMQPTRLYNWTSQGESFH